jgi:tRNA dimethylallyltransferase
MSWSAASGGMGRDALVITGATATGKTALAVAVARRVGGEVISFDSRQVYRGMDIGTAKPDDAERGGVPHHGFDLVEPNERFSAGMFARFARPCLAAVRARGAVPILAGGTGFFLRALTHPLFEEPLTDSQLKEDWIGRLRAFPVEELRRWAQALDPIAAARVEDRQRLSRIVEVAMLTGRQLSRWQESSRPVAAPLDAAVFVLELPRAMLVERIERRVDSMIEAGLVDEVRSLAARGFGAGDPGMNATGYIELLPYLAGERTLDDAVALIGTATRQYARRQSTWLRHQLPSGAHRLDARRPVGDLADEVAKVWEEEAVR